MELPFSAAVELEKAGLAVQLVLVEPSLGGVLISGVRGTGKSTLVRGSRYLHPDLPPEDSAVEVPLGVTEQNLLGGIDFKSVLSEGSFRHKPGLLEKADRRILVMDNINLQSDRIVDLILDSAASGILTVEREGVSVVRKTRFKLFATMDPTEGRLRPQLLDRFDLSVNVNSIMTGKGRMKLIQRVLACSSPDSCYSEVFRDRDQQLREKIRKARRRLPRVGIKVRALSAIVFAVSMLEIDGHRPEIVLTKASGALAALRGRSKVIWDDVRDVSYLVLGHRTRKGGLEGPPEEKTVLKALRSGWNIGSKYGMSETLLQLWDSKSDLFASIVNAMNSAEGPEAQWSTSIRSLQDKEGMFRIQFPEFMEKQVLGKIIRKVSETAKVGTGSRQTKVKPSAELERGKRVRVVRTEDPGQLDILQTVTAAAIQGMRLPFFPVRKQLWRAWERSSRPRATVMLVVDASKSSKGYLYGLSGLLKTMFEEHFDPLSRVGLISMNRGAPVLHFKPTRNRLRVYGRMRELTSSGYTPIAEAISRARTTLQKENRTGDIRGNFILLVSDCAPEPLPIGCRDPFESRLYGAVKMEAWKCRSAGIPILVIDPLSYPSLKSPEEMPGRRLARFMVNVSRGILLSIPARVLDSENMVMNVISSVANRGEKKAVQSDLRSGIRDFTSLR